MTARAASMLFVPHPPLAAARMIVASTLAAALLPRRPRSAATAMRDWLGLDLSRSWALAFMRAAAAPVLAVLVLFGWGLTGIEALRVDQRAIYQRLGRPVAVLGPGLHLTLPWPLGRLRPVELGVVHSVPIVFSAPGASTLAVPAPTRIVGAEASPGPSEDRLWDETHPSEGSYLVASLSRGQQSFQSIDIDLRVVWRIAVSDKAAYYAAFDVEDPQRLVQATASRLLARYFAGHTLPGILGADRAGFSQAIADGLQTGLDRMGAGVEIVAVVVEAIHPPPGAAPAYRAVQTASIGSHTAIAEQTGYAVTTQSAGRRDASALRDIATAGAHEAVTEATVRATGFSAARTAWAASPVPFLLERRLEKLNAGLAHRQVLILDHRLQPASEPLLDLRPQVGPSGSTAAAPMPPPGQ